MPISGQNKTRPRSLMHYESLSLVSVDGRSHALFNKLASLNLTLSYYTFEDENWSRIDEIETSKRPQILVQGNLQSVKTSFVTLALLERGFEVFFLVERPQDLQLSEWHRLQSAQTIPISPMTCLSEIEYGLKKPKK